MGQEKMKTILETKRLFLREMDSKDYDALSLVLVDSDNMKHYPYTFDEKRVKSWIDRNMQRYREDGFGLWAVCLKETGELIGDCGLTLQMIHGEILPEIGYHIRACFQRIGYAKEAAKAVRDWAFRNTDYPALYSYCKNTNLPSIRTAEAIGMHFDCEYPDEANGITHVSSIHRDDLMRNMIDWAESMLGCKDYANWNFSFMKDAFEISNDSKLFTGDSVQESCRLYQDALQSGMPEKGAFVFYDFLRLIGCRPVNWGHCGISLGDGKIIHAWDEVRIDDYRQVESFYDASGDHPVYIGWVPFSRVLRQKP